MHDWEYRWWRRRTLVITFGALFYVFLLRPGFVSYCRSLGLCTDMALPSLERLLFFVACFLNVEVWVSYVLHHSVVFTEQ